MVFDSLSRTDVYRFVKLNASSLSLRNVHLQHNHSLGVYRIQIIVPLSSCEDLNLYSVYFSDYESSFSFFKSLLVLIVDYNL